MISRGDAIYSVPESAVDGASKSRQFGLNVHSSSATVPRVKSAALIVRDECAAVLPKGPAVLSGTHPNALLTLDTPSNACIPGEPYWNLLFGRDEPGFLDGANLIPAWTVDRHDGTIDIYRNASTWAPYQVVLMRGTVRK